MPQPQLLGKFEALRGALQARRECYSHTSLPVALDSRPLPPMFLIDAVLATSCSWEGCPGPPRRVSTVTSQSIEMGVTSPTHLLMDPLFMPAETIQEHFSKYGELIEVVSYTAAAEAVPVCSLHQAALSSRITHPLTYTLCLLLLLRS